MISGSIARRYAKALLQLGVDGNNFEALGAELARFVRLLGESTELGEALSSPVVPQTRRKAILAEVLARLEVSKTIEHYLQLLVDHNRMDAVVAIEREFRALVDVQAGRVRGVLTSARPLPPEQAERIRKALEVRTGKQVILESRQDPALLAGVVVQIGDVIYDGSARSALATIREELLQR
jgi:F-type H+-transporting ATPase subunit delta